MRKLKWKSTIKFEKGLEETFDWYLKIIIFLIFFSKKKFFKRLGLNT